MGKYVDMESGIVKESGLEIEDVIQKILHDFFKYENNSLSTEDDDSKKVSNYFIKQKYYILLIKNMNFKRTRTHHKETMTNLTNLIVLQIVLQMK